jgi:hypothetical protein
LVVAVVVVDLTVVQVLPDVLVQEFQEHLL